MSRAFSLLTSHLAAIAAGFFGGLFSRSTFLGLLISLSVAPLIYSCSQYAKEDTRLMEKKLDYQHEIDLKKLEAEIEIQKLRVNKGESSVPEEPKSGNNSPR